VNIALIDYGAGNLHSAAKALLRAGDEAGLRAVLTITSDPEVVRRADRIVLPGDGAFADCMSNLQAVPGLTEALDERVRRQAVPFLGICVGMQLLASVGLEHGQTQGLGWIPGRVDRICPADAALKVPHMGWNTLHQQRHHALTAGLPLGPAGLHAYFLHGYHLVTDSEDDVIVSADYGMAVTAMVARETMVGTQFHPEKSQVLGLALLRNFLLWRP